MQERKRERERDRERQRERERREEEVKVTWNRIEVKVLISYRKTGVTVNDRCVAVTEVRETVSGGEV